MTITELVAELMDNMKKAVQKPLIEEFLADLKDFELKKYSDMIRTLKRLREKYHAKIKKI